jgi:hypothetical protein
LGLTTPVLSAETLRFDVRWVEFSDSLIVKLYPQIIALLPITEVVTKISSAKMHNNADKFITEFVVVLRQSFLLRKCIIVDIELMRELPSRVDFLVL